MIASAVLARMVLYLHATCAHSMQTMIYAHLLTSGAAMWRVQVRTGLGSAEKDV